MTKPKSLSQGIGNNNQVKRYYDEWSTNYDRNLKGWGYTAPTKSAIILQKHLLYHPDKILDMACYKHRIMKFYIFRDAID